MKNPMLRVRTPGITKSRTIIRLGRSIAAHFRLPVALKAITSVVATVSVLGLPMASVSASAAHVGAQTLTPALSSTTHPVPPQIVSFSVAPKVLRSTGGKLTISARVEHARACVFSSTPALSSMPVTVPCGSAMLHSLTLPANESMADRIYTFHLSATGPGGPVNGHAVKVSVRPATPKVMSFAVVPRTVSSAGGKVTISARVEHAHTCVVSSSPALVSMPMTFSCKSAMSHSMAIPANSSSIERVYSFHVSAAGPGGTTKGSAVTVMEQAVVPPTTTTTSTTTLTTTSSTTTTSTTTAPIVFFPPPPTTATTVPTTVTFAANAVGTTGTMANEVEPYGSATDLTASGFSYTGHTFAGWNAAANGSGTAYLDGASYPFTASAMLYAQWTALTVQTITMALTGSPTSSQPYNVDASSNDVAATLAYTVDGSTNSAGCAVDATTGAVTFTGTGAGTCTIDVNSGVDTTNGYAAAPQAQQVLTVAPVGLGTAGAYAVLGTTVTNGGATVLNGYLGSSSPIAGPELPTVNGQTHVGDSSDVQAQTDLGLAYDAARGLTHTATFSGDQNGLTLLPGVYYAGAAIAVTGTMTLNGGGDPNAVFVFQVEAALNTGASSAIVLTNGAKASNVFWQVLGAANTGAGSSFAGTIMASGAITLGAGASVYGRALSLAAITLAANTVTVP